MKRTIAIALLLVMLLVSAGTTTMLTAAAAPNASDWARQPLEQAQRLGLTGALEGDLTAPVTRLQFAHLLDLLLKKHMEQEAYQKALTAAKAVSQPFADCDDSSVLLAHSLGIVKGLTEDRFGPNATITREQAATLLQRTVGVLNPDLLAMSGGIAGYADRAEAAAWAQEGISYCILNTLMKGVGEAKFAPQSSYSVEQSVATLLRLHLLLTGEAPLVERIGSESELFDVLAMQSGSYFPYPEEEVIEADLPMDQAESGSGANPQAPAPMAPAAPAAAADSKGERSSATNTQVEGVDEADIVKTDGTYIYLLRRGALVVLQANPLKKLSETSVVQDGYTATDLYLQGGRAVVVTSGYEPGNGLDKPIAMPSIAADSARVMPYPYYRPVTMSKVFVLDLADKAAPRIEGVAAVEGNLISSRLVGERLVLVTSKYIGYGPGYEVAETLPFVTRSTGPVVMEGATLAFEAETAKVAAQDVYWFPGCQFYSQYTVIASVSIADRTVKTSALLGNTENMYMTPSSLYIAGSRYAQASGTALVKFDLTEEGLSQSAAALVPGTILNQFAMDEFEGSFRIATTSGPWNKSVNNLYVLDGDLKQLGSLEGLAPGERIESVRFLGKTAYVVTFRTRDPLFVIDLTNPAAPKVTGELKIPGFSTYLHPVGDGLLLGIGKDTVDIIERDAKGNERIVGVRESGYKLSLFDVSDPAKPREADSTSIAGDYSYIEAAGKHTALMVDPELHRFGFVAVETAEGMSPWEGYGSVLLTANLYGVDASAKKLKPLLKDSLAPQADYYSYLYSSQEPLRMVFVGDTLYVVRGNTVTTFGYSSFAKTGELVFGS